MQHYTKSGDIKPLQKIPLKEKLAKDAMWGKDNHEHYLGIATLDEDEKEEMLRAYDIVNGRISPEDSKKYFGFVENPYGSERSALKGYPARMRNLSIIKPNIDLLRGSYRQMNLDHQVKAVSDGTFTIQEEMKKRQIKKALTDIAASLIEGKESSAMMVPPVKDVQDVRAKGAAIQLERIKRRERVAEKFAEMFFDFIVAGRTVSMKTYNRSVTYKRMSPFDTHSIRSRNARFFEDGEAAVCYEYMTLSDIFEEYHDKINEDPKMLEALDIEATLLHPNRDTFSYDSYRDNSNLHLDNFMVSHTFFITYIREYEVSYVDEFGQFQTRIERETEKGGYKAQEGEEVEMYWVEAVWRTTKVHLNRRNDRHGDDADGIYIINELMEDDFRDPLEPSRVKLPINGMDYSDSYSRNTSPTRLMISYEILYRIIWWRMEFTIAKNRGKFVLLDSNAIPKGEGKEEWDEEMFYYNAEVMSIGLLDRSQKGVDRTWNQYQVIDLSMYEHIQQYMQLLQFIKSEADAILGITPPRKGITKTTDTATGVATSNAQSSVMSEELFSKFSEFMERELNGLLDLSRYEVLNDGELIGASEEEKEIVRVDGVKYFSTAYSIFVVSSSKDSLILEKYKNLAQEFAQNGASTATIADILTAESMSQVTTKLHELEAQEQMRAEKAAEQEQLSAQELEKMRQEITMQYKQMESVLKINEINAEWDRKDRNSHIEGSYNIASFQGTLDVDQNNVPDAVDIQKGLNDRQKIANEKTAKDKELTLKDKELNLKDKEIESKERIAKRDAEVKLKNPVPGEK